MKRSKTLQNNLQKFVILSFAQTSVFQLVHLYQLLVSSLQFTFCGIKSNYSSNDVLVLIYISYIAAKKPEFLGTSAL